MPTAGHPVVYGEWLGAPGKPTVLIYGHYDVQPVDPIDLWDSPPFEPIERDGLLFGRGASDDKGQVLMHVAAVESWLRVGGGLPVNVKVLIEGEEEIGSDHLGPFVAANARLLAADVVVISDTDLFAQGLPAICYGLRGILYFQIDVEVAGRDLHSGSYGGSVGNPIDALAQIIAGLKDDDGRMLVPGFYDDVRPITAQERDEFGRLPFTEAGSSRRPAPRRSTASRATRRSSASGRGPTLDPNGIWGGFTGEGSKTVLPSQASAKVSCRLVPDQDPARRRAAVRGARSHGSARRGRGCRITDFHHGRPGADADRPPGRPGGGAGARGRLRRASRSSPGPADRSRPSTTMQEALGAPTVLMGIGLPDDHAHAPNERLDVESLHAGIRSAAFLWSGAGGIGGALGPSTGSTVGR